MVWTSADTIAEQASRAYRDTRTRQQRAWDERAEAIAEIVARMRGLTYPAMGDWSRDPAIVDLMTDYARDMVRELHALNVEGFREGDTARGGSMSRVRTRTFGRENEDCVIVTYTQTPFIPAKLYGRPEDCYPAEGGEVEVISVKLDTGEDTEMSDAEEDQWITDIMENPDADDAPDADDLRDRARDRELGQ